MPTPGRETRRASPFPPRRASPRRSAASRIVFWIDRSGRGGATVTSGGNSSRIGVGLLREARLAQGAARSLPSREAAAAAQNRASRRGRGARGVATAWASPESFGDVAQEDPIAVHLRCARGRTSIRTAAGAWDSRRSELRTGGSALRPVGFRPRLESPRTCPRRGSPISPSGLLEHQASGRLGSRRSPCRPSRPRTRGWRDGSAGNTGWPTASASRPGRVGRRGSR